MAGGGGPAPPAAAASGGSAGTAASTARRWPDQHAAASDEEEEEEEEVDRSEASADDEGDGDDDTTEEVPLLEDDDEDDDEDDGGEGGTRRSRIQMWGRLVRSCSPPPTAMVRHHGDEVPPTVLPPDTGVGVAATGSGALGHVRFHPVVTVHHVRDTAYATPLAPSGEYRIAEPVQRPPRPVCTPRQRYEHGMPGATHQRALLTACMGRQRPVRRVRPVAQGGGRPKAAAAAADVPHAVR